METATSATGSPRAPSQDTKQSQGAGAAQGTGGKICAVPTPALVPTKGRDKPVHWAQQESKRKGPRVGEREEAEWEQAMDGARQGSGSFPRAQQNPSSARELQGWRGHGLLGGDGKTGGD